MLFNYTVTTSDSSRLYVSQLIAVQAIGLWTFHFQFPRIISWLLITYPWWTYNYNCEHILRKCFDKCMFLGQNALLNGYALTYFPYHYYLLKIYNKIVKSRSRQKEIFFIIYRSSQKEIFFKFAVHCRQLTHKHDSNISPACFYNVKINNTKNRRKIMCLVVVKEMVNHYERLCFSLCINILLKISINRSILCSDLALCSFNLQVSLAVSSILVNASIFFLRHWLGDRLEFLSSCLLHDSFHLNT